MDISDCIRRFISSGEIYDGTCTRDDSLYVRRFRFSYLMAGGAMDMLLAFLFLVCEPDAYDVARSVMCAVREGRCDCELICVDRSA